MRATQHPVVLEYVILSARYISLTDPTTHNKPRPMRPQIATFCRTVILIFHNTITGKVQQIKSVSIEKPSQSISS